MRQRLGFFVFFNTTPEGRRLIDFSYLRRSSIYTKSYPFKKASIFHTSCHADVCTSHSSLISAPPRLLPISSSHDAFGGHKPRVPYPDDRGESLL